VSHYCGAKNEALLIMNEVVEHGDDENAVGIAKSVLEEINPGK
jgi:hypothetical protein